LENRKLAENKIERIGALLKNKKTSKKVLNCREEESITDCERFLIQKLA